MSSSSLINLGELSKPATVLIEKVSDAVGGILKPWQIRRVAKAEADAELVRAESQIAITELQRRAMHRLVNEEEKKQANIEEITAKALPLLTQESKPQEIEDDWITNFFEKSRIISDEQMQQLWSRLLAGEANSPGSFSRRTVNLVSDLDKRDAELFAALSRFVWIIGEPTPVIFGFDVTPYSDHGIIFPALSHLESLGLIQVGALGGFSRTRLPERFSVSYFGTEVAMSLPPSVNGTVSTGNVLFTQPGRELFRICNSRTVDGFLEFVCSKWHEKGITTEVAPGGTEGHKRE